MSGARRKARRRPALRNRRARERYPAGMCSCRVPIAVSHRVVLVDALLVTTRVYTVAVIAPSSMENADKPSLEMQPQIITPRRSLGTFVSTHAEQYFSRLIGSLVLYAERCNPRVRSTPRQRTAIVKSRYPSELQPTPIALFSAPPSRINNSRVRLVA